MVAHDIGPDGDAEVTILDHPVERSDFEDFKKFQVLLALRERTRLDDKFFAACSDIVSIHLRLSEASRGLLNRKRLAKMKPDALLINTARGAIVDEDALVEALRENRPAGWYFLIISAVTDHSNSR